MVAQKLDGAFDRLAAARGQAYPLEARPRLSELRTMVTGAIASVRQFSRDLRPLALEDLGLVAAMQYQVNQLAQSERIDVNFEVEGTTDGLPADMEIAIYRILQDIDEIAEAVGRP